MEPLKVALLVVFVALTLVSIGGFAVGVSQYRMSTSNQLGEYRDKDYNVSRRKNAEVAMTMSVCFAVLFGLVAGAMFHEWHVFG